EVPGAIGELLDDMRADIEELHTARTISRARALSAQIGVPLNHNTYPVYFTGDPSSRVVLVHHNPTQRANDGDRYQGVFEHGGFDEYLEEHRRYGHYHWEIGEEQPSPVDYKQMRFLRHWGLSDLVDGETRAEQRANVARAVDERLEP